MKISYGITICNELEEIKVLLTELFDKVSTEDEIVVLYDDKNGDPEVWDYLNLILKQPDIPNKMLYTHRDKFNNNFSEWKNKLNSLCRGDFIFNIDADEIPSEFLLHNIKQILKSNPTNDLFITPRINKVEGLTPYYIKKWKWAFNEKGWVNFPDYQMRIYRNTPEIKWEHKVHEKLTGFNSYAFLPATEQYSIKHFKTIEKQEKQNNYYENI